MSIFRFYNQNRFLFWTIIIAVLIILFVINIINSIIADNNSKPQNVVIDEKLYENKISIEEQISDEQVEEDSILVIDQFIKYCNAKNTQNAYNLLTKECKEEVFPTIETFENNYLKLNFNTQKLYSKEKYLNNTYKVILYENILNTGNVNGKLNQDYYTIVEQDGKSKLNVSNYVKRQQLSRKTKNDKMQIEIVKKDIYMEYEIYELKVTNLTQNMIILDTKEKTKTMYLLDENNIKYYSASHEIIDSNLYIKPMSTNIISIKYTKEYRSNSSEKLVFEDIVLDYIENTKANDYKKTTMEINV